jgi:pimeloyl-ACP methyl ester carboxylesterase
MVLPMTAPPRGMPMSLLLHGLGGSARSAAPHGLVHRLSRAVARGTVPPYGFVAVDGGNDYWHEQHDGDDPMTMLLEEVPGWLRQRGLGGAHGLPFACAGISMGGFGTLVYARRRGERNHPLRAIAAISPGLLTDWTAMRRRHAFDGRADWAALDPLRHIEATREVPTAVWCGTEDRFVTGVRRFVRRAHPEQVHITRGRHNDRFFASTVPGVVAFLGKHLRHPRPR